MDVTSIDMRESGNSGLEIEVLNTISCVLWGTTSVETKFKADDLWGALDIVIWRYVLDHEDRSHLVDVATAIVVLYLFFRGNSFFEASSAMACMKNSKSSTSSLRTKSYILYRARVLLRS